MEIRGKCLKNDFYIPKNDLIKNILTVIDQERLILNKDKDELRKALNVYRKGKSNDYKTQDVKPLDDLVLALAIPVWYYENLLSIRPRSP
jgi:hypothetical protein